MNDNFASVVEAVKWGRCVYDNICKFLQFQLTVNLTACVIAVVGASILTKSPLTVIQLLWVNMIMDSFASLALATEDPKPDLLRRKPYPRDQQLLSPMMLRSLISHATYQLIVLFIVIFAVGDVCPDTRAGNMCRTPVLSAGIGGIRSGRPPAFDKEFFLADTDTCLPVFKPDDPSTYDWVPKNTTYTCTECGEIAACEKKGCYMAAKRPEGYCEEQHATEAVPNQHNTIIFTVFVLMQLFNQLNARKIHGETNVFEGVLDNRYFLAIMGLEFLMQLFMAEVPGLNLAMGCAGMTVTQWILCILIGASELALNPLIQKIPLSWLPAAWTGGFGKQAQDDGIPLLDIKGQRSEGASVVAT
jgi:magnesium-transporting ATPase (P-type)